MQTSQLSISSSASCSCQLILGCQFDGDRNEKSWIGGAPRLRVILGVLDLVLGDDVRMPVEDEEPSGPVCAGDALTNRRRYERMREQIRTSCRSRESRRTRPA